MSAWKKIMYLLVLGVFGIVAYFGYQFISEAERSASGIQHPTFNKNNNLDFSKFDQTIPLPSNRTLPQAREHGGDIINSSGEDLQIKAGEFAYRQSQPTVSMALHNRSHFTITAAAVSLSLFLNDEKEPIASAIGIPITLREPLLPQSDVVVSVPVVGEDWQQDAVRMAQSRRVLAQIISVNDGDNQNVEYQQNGQSVYLKQIGNDWTGSPDKPLIENVFASHASEQSRQAPPDFADPTAGMDLTIPPPIEPVKIKPVEDFNIDPKLLETPQPIEKQEPLNRQPENPENAEQTGIISYEVQTFTK